jgi:FtsH-binding integral membrane protein
MPAPTSPRHPYVGALAVLAGAGVALMVSLQPHKLRAPAWVAYAAALAFVFAGVSMLAQASGASRRVLAWIGVLLVACLMAPVAWIAIAAPDGRCQVSFLGSFMPGTQWICRAGFMLGAAIGVLILVVMLRQAMRPTPSE